MTAQTAEALSHATGCTTRRPPVLVWSAGRVAQVCPGCWHSTADKTRTTR